MDKELVLKVGKNNVEIIKEWLSKQPHLPAISGKKRYCKLYISDMKMCINNVRETSFHNRKNKNKVIGKIKFTYKFKNTNFVLQISTKVVLCYINQQQ